jgi:hypothetical protein
MARDRQLPAWAKPGTKLLFVQYSRWSPGAQQVRDGEITRVTKTSVFAKIEGSNTERRYVAAPSYATAELEPYGRDGVLEWTPFEADGEYAKKVRKDAEFQAALSDVISAAAAIAENRRDTGLVLEQVRRLRGALGDNFVELAEGRGY